MHSVILYLLYWLATAAGIAVVGLVLMIEAFAAIALLGASRKAAAAEPLTREEPDIVEPTRP